MPKAPFFRETELVVTFIRAYSYMAYKHLSLLSFQALWACNRENNTSSSRLVKDLTRFLQGFLCI